MATLAVSDATSPGADLPFGARQATAARGPGGTSVDWDQACVRHRKGLRVGPVDLSVHSGQVLGLVGANGAGKTTLLKAVCGLARLASGRVLVGSVPVQFGHMPSSVGALIEEPAFLTRASAWDNLTLAAAGRSDQLGRREQLLVDVGLLERAHDRVASYSQGMRQRLGIARALLADPAVVVLDEPTNGLDPHGIRWVRELVVRLAGRGRVVLLSSHLLAEVQVLADVVAVVVQGQVLVSGPTREVLAAQTTLEHFYFESEAARPPAQEPR